MKTLALLAILLVTFSFSPGSQISAADPESYRLSVDVNLVLLQATVRDRQGRFVADLGEPDFQVYEDGVPPEIASDNVHENSAPPEITFDEVYEG